MFLERGFPATICRRDAGTTQQLAGANDERCFRQDAENSGLEARAPNSPALHRRHD